MDPLFQTIIPDTSLGGSGAIDPNVVAYNFENNNYLFKRNWRLTLQPPAATVGPNIASVFAGGLRIVFDIERNAFSTANKGKIQVYNLSAQSRNRYFKGSLIKLEIGYGDDLGTIFAGDVSGRVMHERKGPDIITTFECGDGEISLLGTTVNNSYPEGTNLLTIVNDLISAMGLTLGVVMGFPTNYLLTKGYLTCGAAKKFLDAITNNYGLQWSVQNGVVQILPKGAAATSTAIVVSQQTGMIGVPSQASGGDNIATFQNLIRPQFAPNALVDLVSDSFNGIFVLKKVHFEGDTHSTNKWTATCECSQVNGATAGDVIQNVGGKIV